VGGVIRYDPNSHDLKAISGGLRNICDLDFDEYRNLFGSDNDQEGSALHSFGRLTHVTEGSHYQWSRGWLQAKEPYRNDLIETIDPALGRFVPFGICYYNEDHLGDAYKQSLVVARWGSRERGRFPLRARGASFASSQKPLPVGKRTAHRWHQPTSIHQWQDSKPHDWLCWQSRSWMPQEDGGPVKHRPKVHNSAIRKENWKLVRLNEKIASDDPAPPWKLYDLVTDIEERNDVADQHDDIVRALIAQFNRWRSSMHPTVESLKEEQPDRLSHSPCTIWRRTRPRSPIFGM
jgi:hypothetical protein